ncbi:MAG TPA: 50S ribosomal protein L24 [Acholeplasmataceae bacterium]|nr:50S ribosomal protein L24 [Acholeplasmataceae bacterium]
MRIKKGDIVAVITGKSKPVRGKYNTGEVLKVMGDRVFVKGINIVTKHNRPSQANPDGGITHEEAPIHISNVAYLDPVTKKPTRIGYQIVDGKKVRVAKASGTIIDK